MQFYKRVFFRRKGSLRHATRVVAPFLLVSLLLHCTLGPRSERTVEAEREEPAPAVRERPASHKTHAVPLEKLTWSGTGCTTSACHGEIEPIREAGSGMMNAILKRGRAVGDADGCTICHGGDRSARSVKAAHRGASSLLAKFHGPTEFLADPASPWVNKRTCGQCHAELVEAQWNSLMMTEAGKIQGTTWAFGIGEGYDHTLANYDTENPSDPHARLGTDAYRAYMAQKKQAHPNIFVDAQHAVPRAVDFASAEDIKTDPAKAGLTYIRSECQRCHLGVKGRFERGDFRGMGCGACHIPYSNEGFYEGADQTVPHEERGHPLVHSIQATREAQVVANGTQYSGIPVETCTTCHNRGKRIGVSYQGLMESAYASPYTEGGGGQPPLHTKHYIALSQDIHYQKGMLCQDCHTSGDVHGDKFIAGSNLAAIEIECTDCHGTPDAFPWELPLGFMDENGRKDVLNAPQNAKPRGLGKQLPQHLRRASPAEPGHEGYIITARGNPMPEVVRMGDEVMIHTASGRDLLLEPLKLKNKKNTLSKEARVAMIQASAHLKTMECYTCHSSWAPQCYGCHVNIDFSSPKKVFDWVAAGHRHAKEAQAAPDERGFDDWLPGETTELRSFMRWENPALGVNGEGRVTPIIPGCQLSATIIGPDGEVVVRNQLFRTPPGTEGAGPKGQISVDMSPVQPHTVGKARRCESCHGSAKAAGYGILGGLTQRSYDSPVFVDLSTPSGKVLSKRAQPQISAIRGLKDWTAVIDQDGRQLMTVGHHFLDSGPLSKRQREKLDRHNVCLGCHQEIPKEDLAVTLLHHVAQMTDKAPLTRTEHEGLIHKILLTAAWSQAVVPVVVLTLLGAFIFYRWRRRRG